MSSCAAPSTTADKASARPTRHRRDHIRHLPSLRAFSSSRRRNTEVADEREAGPGPAARLRGCAASPPRRKDADLTPERRRAKTHRASLDGRRGVALWASAKDRPPTTRRSRPLEAGPRSKNGGGPVMARRRAARGQGAGASNRKVDTARTARLAAREPLRAPLRVKLRRLPGLASRR